MISQKPVQQFESECKRVKLYIEDMPLGALHDFLSEMKSHVVEHISKLNKKEEEEKQKTKTE